MESEKTTIRTIMNGTKLKIFEAALNLFSTRGYSNVGIRDIADAVNIRSASLYNHFASKDAILESAYDFFHDNFFGQQTELREILKSIPVTPPKQILEALMQPFFDQTDEGLTKKILLIAIKEQNNDQRAAYILSKLQTDAEQRVSSTLKRMQELELIEPFDTDAFAAIFVSFSMSIASSTDQNGTVFQSRWQAGRQLLLSVIKTVDKT